MSIEFEPIHVRPMTEIPTCDFRYVANYGIISCLYHPESFDHEMHEQAGWIPARATHKPTQPKEGEWWMCRYRTEEFETLVVLIYRDGGWYNTEKSNNDWAHKYTTALYKMERAKE